MEGFVTSKEAAKLIGVSIGILYQAMFKERFALPPRPTGGAYQWRTEDLNRASWAILHKNGVQAYSFGQSGGDVSCLLRRCWLSRKQAQMEQKEKLKDVWQYYDRLVTQAERKCFDTDKAMEAVVEVFEKITSGTIDLSGVKHPYTYLVKCVQNQTLNNHRKLKAAKRRKDIQNMVLVGGCGKLEGMAADAEEKRKTGLTKERAKPSTHDGGGMDFGWHVSNPTKRTARKRDTHENIVI